MKHFITVTFCVWILCACTQRAERTPEETSSPPSTDSAALIQNPGFESGTIEPWGTAIHANPQSYDFQIVTDAIRSGRYTLKIQGDGREPWGGIIQNAGSGDLAGKRMRLTAWAKGTGLVEGVQFIVVFKDTMAMPVDHVFSNLGASFDWQELHHEFDVPDQKTRVEIGVMLLGAGTLWLDDISLEVIQPSQHH